VNNNISPQNNNNIYLQYNISPKKYSNLSYPYYE